MSNPVIDHVDIIVARAAAYFHNTHVDPAGKVLQCVFPPTTLEPGRFGKKGDWDDPWWRDLGVPEPSKEDALYRFVSNGLAGPGASATVTGLAANLFVERRFYPCCAGVQGGYCERSFVTTICEFDGRTVSCTKDSEGQPIPTSAAESGDRPDGETLPPPHQRIAPGDARVNFDDTIP